MYKQMSYNNIVTYKLLISKSYNIYEYVGICVCVCVCVCVCTFMHVSMYKLD